MPVNLSYTSYSPAIGNESQFTPATEYETSDQSITSFAETLPDDVLFYQDSFQDGTIELADYGEDQDENYDPNYVKTQALDADPFTEVGIDIEIWFDIDIGIEGFSYASYLYATSQDDCNIGFWNFDTTSFDNFEEPLPTSYDWMNGTVTNADYWNATHIGCQLSETGIGDADFFWDYSEVILWKMTLADLDHYAESFTDVSDWTTSDVSISSDGDLATITENGAGSTGRAYASMSSTDFFEYYYEFRIESMTATTASLEFWDGGSYNTLDTFTAAGTQKGIISNTNATTMQRIGFYVGSEGGNVTPDYLRISLANETGWQHDGSTTEGVTNSSDSEITYSASTDGDILTLSAVRNAGSGTLNAYFRFVYDTTATGCDIERDYYQFFKLRYNATLQGGNSYIAPKFSLDGYWGTIDLIEDGTFRMGYINAASFVLAGADKYVEFSANLDVVGKGFTLEIDYIKAYSIANFTVTQSGTSTDDILYVESNILYCSGTSFTSFVLDHDPALSVDTDTPISSTWTMTTSSGTPEADFYITDWLGYSSATSGDFPDGTLTDIRLKFTDFANIEALIFYSPIPQWYTVGIAILQFIVPLNTIMLDGLLILLGLCMIPASTLYLAYGVKHDRSSNRLFYGLIILMLGFGLLIGGIMP
jgi:hypothetical protein